MNNYRDRVINEIEESVEASVMKKVGYVFDDIELLLGEMLNKFDNIKCVGDLHQIEDVYDMIKDLHNNLY